MARRNNRIRNDPRFPKAKVAPDGQVILTCPAWLAADLFRNYSKQWFQLAGSSLPDISDARNYAAFARELEDFALEVDLMVLQAARMEKIKDGGESG